MSDEIKKDDAIEDAVEEKKGEATPAEEPKVEEKPKAEEKPAEEKKEEVVDEGAQAKATKGSSPDASDEEASRVEVPKKFKDIVDAVENMSVLDLNELVKLLEKKFGVSATAVAVAGSGADAEGDEGAQSSFTVELTSIGDGKVAVIKAVKEILGLGLKEAKDLVESAPVEIKKDLKKEEAEEVKGKLEEAGGQAALK